MTRAVISILILACALSAVSASAGDLQKDAEALFRSFQYSKAVEIYQARKPCKPGTFSAEKCTILTICTRFEGLEQKMMNVYAETVVDNYQALNISREVLTEINAISTEFPDSFGQKASQRHANHFSWLQHMAAAQYMLENRNPSRAVELLNTALQKAQEPWEKEKTEAAIRRFQGTDSTHRAESRNPGREEEKILEEDIAPPPPTVAQKPAAPLKPKPADPCPDLAAKIEKFKHNVHSIEILERNQSGLSPECRYFFGVVFFDNRNAKGAEGYLERAIAHFKAAADGANQDIRGKAKLALVKALLEKQQSVGYYSREMLLFQAFDTFDDIRNAFPERQEVEHEIRRAIQTHLETHRHNPLTNKLNHAAFLPICRQLNLEQYLLPEATYKKITQYEKLADQPKSRENVNTVVSLLQGDIGNWIDKKEQRTYEQLARFYTSLDEGIREDANNNYSQAAGLYSKAKEAINSSAIPPGSDSHLARIAREVDCRHSRAQQYTTLSTLLSSTLQPTGNKDLSAVQTALQTIKGQQKTIDSLAQPCQSHNLDWALFDSQLEELAAYYRSVEPLLGPNKESDPLGAYYATNQHYKNQAGLHLARHFYDQFVNLDLTADLESAKRRLAALWLAVEAYDHHLKGDSARTHQELHKAYSQHLGTLSQKVIDAIANLEEPLSTTDGRESFDKQIVLANSFAVQALQYDPQLETAHLNKQIRALESFRKQLERTLHSAKDSHDFSFHNEQARHALTDGSPLPDAVVARLMQEITIIEVSIAKADQERNKELYENDATDSSTNPTALPPPSSPVAPQKSVTEQGHEQKTYIEPPILAETKAADALDNVELEKMEQKISQAMHFLEDFHFQAAYRLLHDGYPDLSAVEKKLPESAAKTHFYPLAATKELAYQLNAFEVNLKRAIKKDCPPNKNWKDHGKKFYTKITDTMDHELAFFELKESAQPTPHTVSFSTRFEKLGHKQRYAQYFRHIFWKEFAGCREFHGRFEDARQNYLSSIERASEPFKRGEGTFPPLMKKTDQRIISLQQKVVQMQNLTEDRKKNETSQTPDIRLPSLQIEVDRETDFLKERINETISQINSFRVTTSADTEVFGQKGNFVTMLSIADNMQSIIRDSRNSSGQDIQKEIEIMCQVFINMGNGLTNINDLRKILGVAREIETALKSYMPDSAAHQLIQKFKKSLSIKQPIN